MLLTMVQPELSEHQPSSLRVRSHPNLGLGAGPSQCDDGGAAPWVTIALQPGFYANDREYAFCADQPCSNCHHSHRLRISDVALPSWAADV